MLHALADHVVTIMSLLKKCVCGNPVTVVNVKTDEHRCDKCCAELARDASLLVTKVGIPKPERIIDNWHDMSIAEAIRTMSNHFEQITEKDVVVH